MSGRSTLLLEQRLREPELPGFLGDTAERCAANGVDQPGYSLKLGELELIDRQQRVVERRTRTARSPAVKSPDSFDFWPYPLRRRGWGT